MKWTDDTSSKQVSKYTPLNKRNIGICFTAPGFHNFGHFATLFIMPATYVSDDEDNNENAMETAPSPDEPEIVMTLPMNLTSPQRTAHKGITTEFQVNPHVIPVEEDPPLPQMNQASS